MCPSPPSGIPSSALRPCVSARYQILEAGREVGRETLTIESTSSGHLLRGTRAHHGNPLLEHSAKVETDRGGRPVQLTFQSSSGGGAVNSIFRIYADRWFATISSPSDRTDYFLPLHERILSPLSLFFTLLDRRVPLAAGLEDRFKAIVVDGTTLIPSWTDATLQLIDEESWEGIPARHYGLQTKLWTEHFWADSDGLVLARGKSPEELTHRLHHCARSSPEASPTS